ncbi:MAG: hypothetical protein ACYC3W_07000 [Candidatus Nanopelagicales bacterium]
MTIKVLKLTDPYVKTASQHPSIKNKKLIARGTFSFLFEGSRPDTVLKMTADQSNYMLLNDYVVRVKGKHFPQIIDCYGEIHEICVDGDHFPVYLYEMERLKKLTSNSEAKRQAKKIYDSFRRFSWNGTKGLDSPWGALKNGYP